MSQQNTMKRMSRFKSMIFRIILDISIDYWWVKVDNAKIYFHEDV